MLEEKVARGRPAGSGLDDRAHLKAIALLVDANPALKPTTAIKSIGITDPSGIRRLRDKFRDAREELLSDIRAKEAKAAEPMPPRAPAVVAPPLPPSLARQTQTAASEPANVVAAARKILSASPIPAANPVASFAAWYGLGLKALSTTVELQIAVIDQVLRVPPVAAAIKQHVLMTEFALAFCTPGPKVRRPLH